MNTEGKVITCKAAVCHKFNTPLKIEDVKVAPPPPEHVRIKMVATSLCHSDVAFWEGYIPEQPLPFIPGHEGAGIVESVGEGVSRLKKGDKVFTLCIPRCYNCILCKSGRSNLCLDAKRVKPLPAYVRSENLDGTTSFTMANGQTIYHCLGTSSFSEYTVMAENAVVKVSPDTPLEKACIMACCFPTGFGAAAKTADIRPGETTAVYGLGGVGLSCVLGCKSRKAGRIIGVDLTNEKEAIARKMGCTDYIAINSLGKNQTASMKIMEMTKNTGVDFSFACIGLPVAMEQAFQSTVIGGTTVIVGVPKTTDIIKVPAIDMLSNRKMMGSIIGDYEIHHEIPQLVERYLKGEFPLDDYITNRMKLPQINEAWDDMLKGKGIRTVVIF